MTRRGRKSKGPQLVEQLEGSPQAKARLQAILETLAADSTIPEACATVGVGESMFHRVRTEALQAALARLEPRPRGRPAKECTEEQRRIEELEQQVTQLQIELQATHLRVELLQALPQVVRQTESELAIKKTIRRQKLQRLLAAPTSVPKNEST